MVTVNGDTRSRSALDQAIREAMRAGKPMREAIKSVLAAKGLKTLGGSAAK